MRRDDWLLRQLPVGMTDSDVLSAEPPFFVRFVTLFQQMADTVMDQVDSVAHTFDPAVAPDNMVRLMAAWFGVDWVDSSLPDRLQREVVMRYADLIAWRGTRRGLVLLLELMTNGPVEVRDSGGVFAEGEAPGGAPHVRLDVAAFPWNRPLPDPSPASLTDPPRQSLVADLSRDDFIRIVRDELPATVTFDLWVAGVRIWPSSEEPPERTGHRPDASRAPASMATEEEVDDA